MEFTVGFFNILLAEADPEPPLRTVWFGGGDHCSRRSPHPYVGSGENLCENSLKMLHSEEIKVHFKNEKFYENIGSVEVNRLTDSQL